MGEKKDSRGPSLWDYCLDTTFPKKGKKIHLLCNPPPFEKSICSTNAEKCSWREDSSLKIFQVWLLSQVNI